MNDKQTDYEPPEGYRGELLERLVKDKIRTWAEIRITKGEAKYEGILLPRSLNTDDRYVTLKVDTGYNLGVFVDDDTKIEEIGYKKGKYKLPSVDAEFKEDLPNVTLLGTGGTVASRLDYRTGAVIPAFTPEELFSAVPELIPLVNLTPKTLYQILSENFQPQFWVKTAESIAKEIESGADGVIIGHGTDTMAFTGSALSYFLRNLPIPVVIVGSQRSSDRPSSDGPKNILYSARLAGYENFAEVVVCMHGGTSDSYNLIHRATRVRKMHSSRRDAFRTIGDIPLGKVDEKEITWFRDDIKPRGPREDFYLDAKIDDKVGMLYFYPGMKPDLLESMVDLGYHGVVIIGTGLAHVGTDMYTALERCQEEEIPVVMTVEPLFGYTHLRVYETGREMLARGVIEGANMLPSAAYAKLIWALGHTRDINEVKKIIQTPVAGEITPKEGPRGYLLMQGIERGIDEFLKHL
ncbi:MAG: Glu-tRNA(Gln) amidotransferase subunit GatD [Candidatus Heimdallarchaeum aukensis]|uniref:Glutamyl-tRNA(Gln) amidotransferase subunit D n=1 Tax=Candidatus Heimdallarchaeum aukensis TaxID=2876573 RepID=A0A9Y1BKI9_9ARCH|nr:MAG: Glu-tRNA(Gln) amidotransferase subunit GatD [Candidatus Heimdallarchaeum aukensis]